MNISSYFLIVAEPILRKVVKGLVTKKITVSASLANYSTAMALHFPYTPTMTIKLITHSQWHPTVPSNMGGTRTLATQAQRLLTIWD